MCALIDVFLFPTLSFLCSTQPVLILPFLLSLIYPQRFIFQVSPLPHFFIPPVSKPYSISLSHTSFRLSPILLSSLSSIFLPSSSYILPFSSPNRLQSPSSPQSSSLSPLPTSNPPCLLPSPSPSLPLCQNLTQSS